MESILFDLVLKCMPVFFLGLGLCIWALVVTALGIRALVSGQRGFGFWGLGFGLWALGVWALVCGLWESGFCGFRLWGVWALVNWALGVWAWGYKIFV